MSLSQMEHEAKYRIFIPIIGVFDIYVPLLVECTECLWGVTYQIPFQ